MIQIIDPCAGMKQLTPRGAVAADIKPIISGVKKVNFLKSKLVDYNVRQKGKIMFVMNPPFKIGVNKDGWELFLNKAGELCTDRPNSCIICVCYASKTINIDRIDKIHPHLHLQEEHRFDTNSPMHTFSTRNGTEKVVPIVVQVWRWKYTIRKETPFYSYTPSNKIPFQLDKGPQYTYYIKIWNSPAKVGEVCKKTGVKKEKGRYVLKLKSLLDNTESKGTVRIKGGSTIFGLAIKPGYTKKVIDWFKKMSKQHKWVDKHTALRNFTLKSNYIYYAYEKKKIPTIKSFFKTSIIQHK